MINYFQFYVFFTPCLLLWIIRCKYLQNKVIITTCTVTGPHNNHGDWTKEIFAHQSFKGCVRYILAILFLSLNESICETRKMFFILFYFKSSLRSQENKILHIQIWWCHQMTKHKTRNTFYWTTWEVITVC